MRIVETASRWGNLYRFRHYIDGKRVSKWEYDISLRTLIKACAFNRKMENTSYGFRVTVKDL